MQLLTLAGALPAPPSQLAISEPLMVVEEWPEAGPRAHPAGFSISSPLEANFFLHPTSPKNCPGRQQHRRGLLPAVSRAHSAARYLWMNVLAGERSPSLDPAAARLSKGGPLLTALG